MVVRKQPVPSPLWSLRGEDEHKKCSLVESNGAAAPHTGCLRTVCRHERAQSLHAPPRVVRRRGVAVHLWAHCPDPPPRRQVIARHPRRRVEQLGQSALLLANPDSAEDRRAPRIQAPTATDLWQSLVGLPSGGSTFFFFGGVRHERRRPAGRYVATSDDDLFVNLAMSSSLDPRSANHSHCAVCTFRYDTISAQKRVERVGQASCQMTSHLPKTRGLVFVGPCEGHVTRDDQLTW